MGSLTLSLTYISTVTNPALTHKLGAASWTRTSHTQIFSLLLYLMSYRDIVLAERLRLELRNRITTIERLAIFSNTIMGPFLKT